MTDADGNPEIVGDLSADREILVTSRGDTVHLRDDCRGLDGSSYQNDTVAGNYWPDKPLCSFCTNRWQPATGAAGGPTPKHTPTTDGGDR